MYTFIKNKKSALLVFFTLIAMMFASVTMATQYAKNISPAPTSDPDMAKEVLITNVNIFNGTSEKLITGKDVVLKGNKIAKIIPAGGKTDGYHEVIDGKGGYLTPGLIDVHWHMGMGVKERNTSAIRLMSRSIPRRKRSNS